MRKGTILGHEGIGRIIEVGKDVHSFKVGDRVIIPSTISCGECRYCKQELYALCDTANPQGPDAGGAYYGGPEFSGPFDGLQAEKARIPFADADLVKVPDNISDEQVILISDILPTAYQAVESAEPKQGDKVAVFGCGPVGQLVIACLIERGIKEIFAIDRIPARLAMAERQGAQTINFDKEDPVKMLKELTAQKGPERIIDAVGIDADQPYCCGLEFFTTFSKRSRYKKELQEVAPKTNPKGKLWRPGTGPSQVFDWAVAAISKGGTFSIIGVYPETMLFYPMGPCMEKNLTMRIGNCNHRKYIPMLLEWVKAGTFDLTPFITQTLAFENVISAYEHFDKREDNWIKVMLKVQ